MFSALGMASRLDDCSCQSASQTFGQREIQNTRRLLGNRVLRHGGMQLSNGGGTRAQRDAFSKTDQPAST